MACCMDIHAVNSTRSDGRQHAYIPKRVAVVILPPKYRGASTMIPVTRYVAENALESVGSILEKTAHAAPCVTRPFLLIETLTFVARRSKPQD